LKHEYIELLPYMVEPKDVFVTKTLYNSYVKSVFGEKEISILTLIDYQDFINDLLLPNLNNDYFSLDLIKQIIEILISISRYAIRASYGISENLPLEIELDFNEEKENYFKKDLNEIQLTIELGEGFLSSVKTIKKNY